MKLHKSKLILILFLLSTINSQLSTVSASVTIDAGETAVLASGEEIVINGTLTIANTATLDTSAGSAGISLNGSWLNSGTYVPLTTKVTFTGTEISTITGTNNFYDLTCTTAGKQFSFESGKEQTVTGALTLTGTAANKILLRALTTGTRWGFNMKNSNQHVDYIDVKDSSAPANIINCYHSVDSGNNAGEWKFVSLTIDDPVSGTTVNTTPVIFGKAGAHDPVTLKDKDGLSVATTSADSSGNYFALVSTPIAAGANSLTAYIETIQGQSIDLTVITSLTGGQTPEILSLATGETIIGIVPTISGKSTPGASVNLLKLSVLAILPSVAVFSDSTYRYELITTTTADTNGNFSFTADDYKDYLTPGVNRFIVTANGARSSILAVNVATPIGIIFDAVKNQPLANAQVSLYRSDGALAQPGVELASTDTNPQTAGSDGSYGFVANTGDYYLTVQLPNYSYPATRNSFTSSRNIITGSKMETFNIGSSILYMDLPMDPSESFSCYPSPFNPYQQNITIQYYLDKDAEVDIAVYDLLGNLVKTWEINSGAQYARRGLNQLPWDGRSGSGRVIANGGYIVLLHADNTTKKFKILVIE